MWHCCSRGVLLVLAIQWAWWGGGQRETLVHFDVLNFAAGEVDGKIRESAVFTSNVDAFERRCLFGKEARARGNCVSLSGSGCQLGKGNWMRNVDEASVEIPDSSVRRSFCTCFAHCTNVFSSGNKVLMNGSLGEKFHVQFRVCVLLSHHDLMDSSHAHCTCF